MKGTARGIITLCLGALCFALGSLCFAKSGAQSSQINTWVGLLGAPLCISLLACDTTFSPFEHRKDPHLYLSLLNGFVFGGMALFLHFWSLEFILPSDNNMVAVFFQICGSVFMQFIEDHQIPSILTFLSIALGLIGTAFVCNPQELLTKDVLQLENLKGVALVATAGFCFAAMYGNSRRFPKISPIWSCFGLVFGILTCGLVSYRPWQMNSGPGNCQLFYNHLLALAASAFQVMSLGFNLTGTKVATITVTAMAVIQLLSPVFSFLMQLWLFSTSNVWRSLIGIMFICLAVATQVTVLRRREKAMQEIEKKRNSEDKSIDAKGF